MINKRNLFRNTTFLFFILILFPSIGIYAQSQRKIARDFIKELRQNKKVVLITEPDYIYKYNLKKDILNKFPNATPREKDSLLWVHSDFIKNIKDSTFLSYFMKGFTQELRLYNLIPYVNKVPLYIAKPSYKISLVQVELEEQYYPFVDSAYYNNKALVFTKNLNAIDFSTWFKIHPLPEIKKDITVLFSEYLLSDLITDGYFFKDPKNGKIVYLYKINRLTLPKIYQYVENLGRIYADYAFDYILNQQIKKKIPGFNPEKNYWHYDPYKKLLYTDEQNHFIKVTD